MQKTIVTIPQPCHENWNAMRPEEQGRFCKACEKIVVDFTNKTPLEIKETLLQNVSGKVCGRFKKSDLNRPLEEVPVLVPVRIKHSWFRSKWLAAATLFTALFAGKKAQAQLQGLVVEMPEEKEKHSETSKQVCKPSPTIIHGQIRSMDPTRGLSQVEIKVFSNGKEITRTFAFNSGYSITLPENTVMDYTVTIQGSAIGFETTVLQEVPVIKNTVALDLLMVPLSEEVMNATQQIFVPEYYTVGEYMIDPPPMQEVSGNIAVEIVKVPDPLVIEPTNPVEETEAEKQKLQQSKEKMETKGYEKPPPTKVVVNFPKNFTVQAYPNPGSGIFQVSIKGSEQTEIFVYSLEGRLVMSKKTSADREVLDLTNEPNGVYLVKAVQPGTNKATQVKVVKTN